MFASTLVLIFTLNGKLTISVKDFGTPFNCHAALYYIQQNPKLPAGAVAYCTNPGFTI